MVCLDGAAVTIQTGAITSAAAVADLLTFMLIPVSPFIYLRSCSLI